jgi:hypothetical protein
VIFDFRFAIERRSGGLPVPMLCVGMTAEIERAVAPIAPQAVILSPSLACLLAAGKLQARRGGQAGLTDEGSR